MLPEGWDGHDPVSAQLTYDCLHNQLVHLNSHSFQIHSFFQRKLASHIKPRSCCVIDVTPLQENGFGFDGLAQKSGLQEAPK